MTEERMKAVYDCETGISEILPMTAEEIAAEDARIAEYDAILVQQNEAAEALAALKAAARAKLIAGEPLTEEEAATIVI